MTFASPGLLWLLLVVPVLGALYVLWQRVRVRSAVRFTNLELLAVVAPRRPSWRRHIPPLLSLLALGLLLVGFARPQTVVEVPKEQATVILLMDVSGSMNATDVRPDRLTAAQAAARSFVDRVPREFRLGLVTFSTTAQTLVTPTTDRLAVENGLDALEAGGGTAMGDAIDEGVRLAQGTAPDQQAPPADGPPTVMLLLSDGASSVGVEPLEAAARARDASVTVFTVALGTDEGVVVVPDENGVPQRVPVPPDQFTLEEIAASTEGEFFDAPGDRELRQVYETLGSELGFEEELREATAAFAGAAALVLIVGAALSLRWSGRFP